jgi:hypothetical protein
MSFITSPEVIVPPLTAGGVAYGTGGQAKVNSAGTAGQVLTSAGAGVPTWATPSASGTVSSVAMTVPSLLSVSGSPITSSGTLAVTYSGTALPVSNGGTGLTTLTANNVILGNGTSAPVFVAPSTSGNVLTSNGTTWSSASPTMVAIGETTLSGSSTTISLDNSTYSSYLFLGSGISTTAAATNIDFYIRVNSVSTASYSSGGFATGNGTPQGYLSGTNTGDVSYSPHKGNYNYCGVSGGITYGSTMMLQVFNIKNQSQTANSQTAFMSTWQSSGGNSPSVGAGGFSGAGVTSITFSWSSAATLTGKIRVYGIV